MESMDDDCKPVLEPIPRKLFNREEAGLYVGVRNARAFDELRKQPGFPKPVALSPRNLRWRRADLDAWVDALPTVDDEPAFALRLAADVRPANQ